MALTTEQTHRLNVASAGDSFQALLDVVEDIVSAQVANIQMQYEASQGALSDLMTEHRELREAIDALCDKWERRSATAVTPSEYSLAFDDGVQHAAGELRALNKEI